MSRRMTLVPQGGDPELDRLLRQSRAVYDAMSPEEKADLHRRQRRSWVIGEMLIEHPEMSQEEAERIYDQVSL